MNKADVKYIIVHCSDSKWGDVAAIDNWHKANGWKGCGYHRVVLNGRRVSAERYTPSDDGLIEQARDLDEVGAQCYGRNRESIGVCVIGKKDFTSKQLASLHSEILGLLDYFDLTPDAVRGHFEFDAGKTCPNMDMDELRGALWEVFK